MLPILYKSQERVDTNTVFKSSLTGSTPTMMQSELCVLFRARETPVMVPPVPAPAMNASTFIEESLEDVDGVDTTEAIISGPVVYS
jgi:hypothetical protein